MFRKNAGKLILSTMLIILAISITACGILGDKKINQKPTVRITSYVGEDSPDSLTGATLFQQKVTWYADDPDGVVIGYAYRILDVNGNPIPTPDHEYIDTNGENTPQGLKDLSPTKFGWVYHYKNGADENIPLGDVAAQKTIITSDVYAMINFPAANLSGDSSHVVSAIEVVAIDNRNEFSPISTKFFNSVSNTPKAFASTSRGSLKNVESDADSSIVGMGLKLVFGMSDYDPYITNIPYYFVFKIQRQNVAPNDTTIIYDSGWVSTQHQPNIKEFLLTQYTTPNLERNFALPSESSNPISKTLLTVYAVDKAGIHSPEVKYEFYVSDKFSPQTLAYEKKCIALGDYHFVEKQDPGSTDILPYVQSAAGTQIATPFFSHPTVDYTDQELVVTKNDFKFTVVGDNQTKVWFRWGFQGEFEGDNPDNKKVSTLRDSLNKNYLSEVKYYYVQLDGQRINFGPLMNQQDPSYPDWLKIPVNSEIAQKISVTDLNPGFHTFRIMVEDLQGKKDPTPYEVTFELVAPKPLSARSGILLISDQAATNPTASVKNRYMTTLESVTNENITFVHWKKISDVIVQNPKMKFNATRVFSPSFLQDFKYVIYYTDAQINTEMNIEKELNSFRVYMMNDGNMMISGGTNITNSSNIMYTSDERAFARFFGAPSVSADIQTITTQAAQKPYFIGAYGTAPFADVDLETTNNPILPLINTKKGLGTITYFSDATNTSITGSVIYRMKCKPVNHPTLPPTADEFAMYNNKPVGVMKTNDQGKGYLFGFPISYLEDADFNHILTQFLQ